MGTAERRLEMMKYLTRRRFATMPELAERFGVSVRTVQRDILELETVLGLPITVRAGNHGGITVMDGYSMDRMYMHDEEISLLMRVLQLVKEQLSTEDRRCFASLIQKYQKKSS